MTYLEQITEAQEFLTTKVKEKFSSLPSTMVVLGSGLGPMTKNLKDTLVIPAADIPHFKAPSVSGHTGEFVFAEITPGHVVCYQSGRLHPYEGHSFDEVNLPVRVLRKMGCDTLVLSNASGALNPTFAPGDLVRPRAMTH